MTSPSFYFIFSKFWVLGVVSGVKGQKNGPKRQKGLSCFISQKMYIIWFSFIVHLYKMIISQVVFFILSKLGFFGLLGEQKGKKLSKVRRNSVCHSISGIIHHMIFIYAFMVQMIISPIICFFHFIKILIFQVFRGVKRAKNSPQKTLSVAPYI